MGVTEGDTAKAAKVPLGSADRGVSLGEEYWEVANFEKRTAITDIDYLLSLVGKDQETIKEAIKELAENSEKFKALENENSDLHIELGKLPE